MSAPAGWHVQGDGRERYWDGTQWTEHFRDQMSPPATAGTAPIPAGRYTRPWYKKKRFLIPAGLVALGIFGSTLPDANNDAVPTSAAVAPSRSAATATPATGSTPSPAVQSPSPSSTASASATAKPKPVSPAKPKPAPSPKPKPAAPVETRSQANAREKAADYLDYSAFSRKGLIEQLKFEGFSTKDATYGADAIKANWNKQAAAKAEEYLDYTSFSRSGLIEQLEFEGFTPAQARYGAKSTGL